MRSFAKCSAVYTLALIGLTHGLVAEPIPVGFRAEKLAAIDQAVEQAIGASKLPGAVIWIERGPGQYHRAYGKRALQPGNHLRR